MEDGRVFFEADGTRYALVPPAPCVVAEGERVHRKAYQTAVSRGFPRFDAVPRVLRERGLWDDAKAAEYARLEGSIAANERLPADERDALATQTEGLRQRLRDLLRDFRELAATSAETHAHDARLAFYVSKCLVYAATGKAVFDDAKDCVRPALRPLFGRAVAHLEPLLSDGVAPVWLRRNAEADETTPFEDDMGVTRPAN